MCVKIIGIDSQYKYDPKIPLEDQIDESKQVFIRYEPKDTDINAFVSEVERISKNGISTGIQIEIKHNDYLNGIKVQRKLEKLAKDIDLNEIIKLIVKLQHKTDIALEELSDFCLGK